MNEKLRRARKDRRWSIDEAAEKIGVSRTTYIRWEQDKQFPHGSSLNMTCDKFKMTPEQLGFEYSVSTSTSSVQVALEQQGIVTLEAPSTDLFTTGMMALSLARQQYGWSFHELWSRTEQEMRRLDAMTQQNQPGEGKLSRRQIIVLLMSASTATLGLPQPETQHLYDDEILALCTVNIPLAWRLYFAGGLSEVKHLLPGYVTKLSTLAEQSSPYQKQAAGLASQAYQLGYLLALQSQDFSIGQTHAKQAFRYAEIAEDQNLRVSSLVRQGNLFFTLKRPLQTMRKYEEAVQSIGNTSPLIVGQAYIGLAEAHARLGQKQEALRYQGLAGETFPERPETDLHFAYTHFNHFTRTNFEGLMFLHLEQPKDAWESFAQIDKTLPNTLVPQRVELLSRQALASVMLGDLEQSLKYVELATKAALQLGSDLRYNEVCETYEQMQAKWPHERSVKALEELFNN